MAKKNFDERKHLNDEQRELFNFARSRIDDLKTSRNFQYPEVEKVWIEADKDYVPHRLNTKGKRVVATDEEKGWRGAMVTLGENNWQSDVSQPNVFIKLQIALATLIDQNPTGVFTANSKKYENTSNLIKQLYSRSWEYAKSKQQLKLFVFNLAKYGWAIGRTYPLKIERKVKSLIEYNQEEPEKSEYEEKNVIEFNDLMRENLDVWNCWIDDMAKPNNTFSVRDWCWRKVYPMDVAQEQFGKYANWKYVKSGGVTTDRINSGKPEKQYKEKDLIEIYFYENRIKDLFCVIANDVPVVIEPLPISDSAGLKKISLWQTYWNLRSAECPYGIGLYESMRYDQGLLDRLRNQTIDQLTLSIYKMFFYQGTQALTETGDIKIVPGTGKQVLDPKNINWMEVPGPGAEAWQGLIYLKNNVDEASGITDPLMGNITGKTAFEIAQAKEAALKRLKIPLENIIDALQIEGYISIALIQMLYSLPEIYKITDEQLINDYLNEIQSDPDLYNRDENGMFEAKVFREFPLNLDKDEKGNLMETNNTRFFRIKPKYLNWEGIISIKPQSILTPSKQVDKALDLEMYNMLIPLLTNPPELYSKIAKELVKLYDKDPKDILPDLWLEEPKPIGAPEDLPLVVGGEQGGQVSGQAEQAQTLVPSVQAPQNPQSIAGQMSARNSQPFR